MSTEQDDIAQNLKLLETYRRSLTVYLDQRAKQGSAFALPGLINSITDAREQIASIKAYLRSVGIDVKDLPIDQEITKRSGPVKVIVPVLYILIVAIIGLLYKFVWPYSATSVGFTNATTSSALTARPVYQACATCTAGPFVSNPTEYFNPQATGETLVIVAAFAGKDNIKPDARIARAIQDELGKYPKTDNIRIERYPVAVQEENSKEILERLKQTYQPSIIIWGWYDDVGITTNYEIIPENSFVPSQYKPSLGEFVRQKSDPDKFTFYIAKTLPQEASFLTFFSIGQIYASRKNYNEALKFLKQAIDNVPQGSTINKDELQFVLAELYLSAGDVDKSIMTTDQYISKNKTNPDMYILRANAYTTKSIMEYVKKNNITIEVSLENIGNIFTTVISSDKEIGTSAYKSDEALESYSYVIDHTKDFSDTNYLSIALLGRSLQYASRGMKSEVISDLERAIANPASVTIPFFAGNIYQEIGETERSINAYKASLKIQPDFGESKQALYSLLLDVGSKNYDKRDYKKAVDNFTEAIGLYPEKSDTYRNRGDSYVGLLDYNRALADFNKALEIDPKNANAYYSRGLLYKNIGERDKAVTDMKHYLTLSNDPKLQKIIQDALAELGE